MTKEYTNNDVYEFLAEECRYDESLWVEFGEGILSRTIDRDFWDSLAEHLDCFRVCDECGKPMIEGFLFEAENTTARKNACSNIPHGNTIWNYMPTVREILSGQHGTKTSMTF